MNDLRFDFIITFPTLDIRGKYDLVFRLFGLSLKGRGDILANFRKNNSSGVSSVYFQFFFCLIRKPESENLNESSEVSEERTNIFEL